MHSPTRIDGYVIVKPRQISAVPEDYAVSVAVRSRSPGVLAKTRSWEASAMSRRMAVAAIHRSPSWSFVRQSTARPKDAAAPFRVLATIETTMFGRGDRFGPA
jgi:hypothetical protein